MPQNESGKLDNRPDNDDGDEYQRAWDAILHAHHELAGDATTQAELMARWASHQRNQQTWQRQAERRRDFARVVAREWQAVRVAQQLVSTAAQK